MFNIYFQLVPSSWTRVSLVRAYLCSSVSVLMSTRVLSISNLFLNISNTYLTLHLLIYVPLVIDFPKVWHTTFWFGLISVLRPFDTF